MCAVCGVVVRCDVGGVWGVVFAVRCVGFGVWGVVVWVRCVVFGMHLLEPKHTVAKITQDKGA